MYKYKRNGFTLVELMAVIIIISLIAILTFPNIVNQIKKTKKSNNKMVEDLLIAQAKKYVSDNKDELLEDEYCMPISTLIDNDYIKEDIVNINDIKDNKVVHITLDNNNSYEVLDKNKCFLSAVKYLLKKTNPITVTNYTDGDIHEMYTFEHEATEQTPVLTDYRYIGSDPNNYVEFNNELWRIIGVFKVENENGNWEERIKIVRNESIGNMAWDSNNVNEWTTASLNAYLNGEYYNSLIDSAKDMIDSVKYYLGGNKELNKDASSYYNFERGTTVYSGNSINWIGKIGLIYVSDFVYTYSNGVLEDSTNSWIYSHMWGMLINCRENQGSTHVMRINGTILSFNSSKNKYGVKPSLYLSSKVKITSGDGTESNPYKLSMK